jgi:flagellar biosynthesis regulator FlaF
MPGGRKALLRRAPERQQSYQAWKAAAANELKDRHGIDATAIAERIWTQFYVGRLDPTEAADRAEAVYRSTREPGWERKR